MRAKTTHTYRCDLRGSAVVTFVIDGDAILIRTRTSERITFVMSAQMGVQLVANRYREETCLAAGEVTEARNSIKLPFDSIDG
jgi:hypothetical protein